MLLTVVEQLLRLRPLVRPELPFLAGSHDADHPIPTIARIIGRAGEGGKGEKVASERVELDMDMDMNMDMGHQKMWWRRYRRTAWSAVARYRGRATSN